MNKKEFLKNMTIKEKAKEALKQNPLLGPTLSAYLVFHGVKKDVSEQELDDMIDVTLIEGYEPDECEDENRSLTLKKMEELGFPTEPTMVISFNQEKH
jgi:hypothetical protein